MASPNLPWGVQVTGQRVTLESLVVRKLKVRDRSAPPDVIDALVKEIWSAPANQHLRQSERDAQPTQSKKSGDLLLYPDEWIYLPMALPNHLDIGSIPNPSLSMSDLTQQIAELLDASGSGAPEGSVTAAQLQAMPLNAGLRAGENQSVVYFFVVAPPGSVIDAAPSSEDEIISNVGRETPPWFLPFWHFLDQAQLAAEQVELTFADVVDTRSEGRFLASSVTMLSEFLAIMDDELGKSGPSLISMPYDLSAIRGALPAFQDVTRRVFSDNAHYPVDDTHQATVDALERLLGLKAFVSAYQAFAKEAQLYPGTMLYFLNTLARCMNARALASDSEFLADDLEKASRKNQVVKDTVLMHGVADFFRDLQKWNDTFGTAVTATIGNVPGPRTVVVAVTKIVLLARLTSPELHQSADAYAVHLGKTFRLNASDLQDLLMKVNQEPALRRAFRSQLSSAEAAAGNIHTGNRLTGAIAILDLLLAIGSYRSLGSDRNGQGPTARLSVAADIANLVGASSAAIGGLAQVLATVRSGGPVTLFLKSGLGYVAAGAGLLAGALQMIQNRGQRTDEEVNKFYQGVGTVLMSSQFFIELALSRFGPQFLLWSVLRLAPLLGVDLAIGIGTVAAGVIASVVSMAAIVGGLILLAFIYRSNKKEIDAILTDLSSPGSLRLVRGYLTYMKGSKVFGLKASDVAGLHKACVEALESSQFVEFLPGDRVKKRLRDIGMNDKDFDILEVTAVLSPTLMAPGGA